MRLTPRSLFVSGLIATAACGYTNPGDGTKTLEVKATATYHENDENVMHVDVTVSKSDAPVSGAQVMVQDADTEETWTLQEDNSPQQVGEYHIADIVGYHRRLMLKVNSGSDNLSARLEGPGPHIILNPKNGDILERSSLGSKLTVQWEVKDGFTAEEVTVSLDHGDAEMTVNKDSGQLQLNTSSLADGDEGVRVIRRNMVDLAGGAGGSAFKIEYWAHNTFTVQ